MSTVTDHFRTVFGEDPEGVWESPGRVNLIGEHTDYNQGLVLPIALPQRTYVAARRRADGLLRFSSTIGQAVVEVALHDIAPGVPKGWARYPAGVLWALREAGHLVGGLDVAIHSEVPVGAGLSSSAALEGAVGAAASDLFGLGLLADDATRATLAGLCQKAENVIAEAPTGGMDQAASLRCTEGHAILLDCRNGHVSQIPFDPEHHGLVVLVIDTHAEHELGDGQYGNRRAACERAAKELGVESLRDVPYSHLADALHKLRHDPELFKRTQHVVTEIQRVRDTVEALDRNDLAEVGLLFTSSHLSLRDDFDVSCDELDVAVDAALSSGALGARMTGGGFGGSAIALVPSGLVPAVTRAVNAAYEKNDFAPASFFLAVPAGGARRTE
ncbi:MAG: galactokinase [Propionibacteriaceae bacterium]